MNRLLIFQPTNHKIIANLIFIFLLDFFRSSYFGERYVTREFWELLITGIKAISDFTLHYQSINKSNQSINQAFSPSFNQPVSKSISRSINNKYFNRSQSFYKKILKSIIEKKNLKRIFDQMKKAIFHNLDNFAVLRALRSRVIWKKKI